MVHLDTFQGHIILYCKGHYKIKKDQFFEGLKMIWAIRCGYDYDPTSRSEFSYVADDMFEIIQKCLPERLPYLMQSIHKEIAHQAFYKPENMSPIEAVIWEYRSILCNLQVREKVGSKHKLIVKIPKPMKQVFNRILNGNGRFKDYDQILKRHEM